MTSEGTAVKAPDGRAALSLSLSLPRGAEPKINFGRAMANAIDREGRYVMSIMGKLLAVLGALMLLFLGLLLAGYLAQRARLPATCLGWADQLGPAASIRAAAATDRSAVPHLCEGLALLAESKGALARRELEAALVLTPATDRWTVQGFIAKALVQDKQIDLAIRTFDEAIAGRRARPATPTAPASSVSSAAFAYVIAANLPNGAPLISRPSIVTAACPATAPTPPLAR